MPASANFPGFDCVCGRSLVRVTLSTTHVFKVTPRNASVIVRLHRAYGDELEVLVMVSTEEMLKAFEHVQPMLAGDFDTDAARAEGDEALAIVDKAPKRVVWLNE